MILTPSMHRLTFEAAMLLVPKECYLSLFQREDHSLRERGIIEWWADIHTAEGENVGHGEADTPQQAIVHAGLSLLMAAAKRA